MSDKKLFDFKIVVSGTIEADDIENARKLVQTVQAPHLDERFLHLVITEVKTTVTEGG